MTVLEVVQVLKNADRIDLLFAGGNCVTLDKDNPIMMDAFGGYKVEGIAGFRSVDEKSGEFNAYDIGIALMPLKETMA